MPRRTTTLPAIPTLYKGTRYRSRLEARHAAWFDALGFKYEYEPIELAGYLPDFLITRGYDAGEPLLVECKPFVDASAGDAYECAKVAAKIAQAWHGHALILCAAQHVEPTTGAPCVLTIEDIINGTAAPTVPRTSRVRIGRARFGDDAAPWVDAYLGRGCPGAVTPCDPEWCEAPWRTTNHDDPDAALSPLDLFAARNAWATAGNVTQWKGGAS